MPSGNAKVEVMSNNGKKKSSPLLTIGIMICLAVIAVSGGFLAKNMLEYRQSQKEYESLRQYISANTEDSTEEVVVDASSDTKEEKKEVIKAPISVDFASLKEVNKDVVGWIYIKSLGISYPVMHGEDNDFYLHHTTDGTYNKAGSIFVEELNSGNFEDPNTIIYGHNMWDKSMFSSLQLMIDDETKREPPEFWILTPEGDYKYEIFSMKVTLPETEVYTIFDGRDAKFVDWAEKMKNESEVDMGSFTFDKDDRIVTLSTCTRNHTNRTVIQGVRVN
ncbi:MAG: class B sortase [Eubacterium sp.]|nr:class B sortase [Eubacterium sp.]